MQCALLARPAPRPRSRDRIRSPAISSLAVLECLVAGAVEAERLGGPEVEDPPRARDLLAQLLLGGSARLDLLGGTVVDLPQLGRLLCGARRSPRRGRRRRAQSAQPLPAARSRPGARRRSASCRPGCCGRGRRARGRERKPRARARPWRSPPPSATGPPRRRSASAPAA